MAEDGQKSGLIISIVIIQILALIGAFLMAKLSIRIGNIKTLILLLYGLCTAAFIVKKTWFYILAALQVWLWEVSSNCSSNYSRFLPETTDHASYFSFYDVQRK